MIVINNLRKFLKHHMLSFLVNVSLSFTFQIVEKKYYENSNRTSVPNVQIFYFIFT